MISPRKVELETMWFNRVLLMVYHATCPLLAFSQKLKKVSELVKCTLDILCIYSGYKYQPCEIVQKINFVMTYHIPQFKSF